MRRLALRKIPNIVPLAGIFLSALIAALSWGIGAVSAVDSVILGLIGTVLSIQLEILVRHEEHYEFANLVTGPEWLYDPIKNIATDSVIIATEFRDTPVEDAARRRIQSFRADFSSLRLGRVYRRPEDSQYLMWHTQDAKSLILAATNLGQGDSNPRWWYGEKGRAYLKENVEAVKRGVVIKRVIIYAEGQRVDALAVAEEQHRAGVQIRLAQRETLRREQRINFAIWDERVSWEAQMNTDGNPIADIYCVGAADIHRLTELHHALWANSADYIPDEKNRQVNI